MSKKKVKKRAKKRAKKDGGKKKKASLRIISTISPASSRVKSGLERDIAEVDLERFSEFIAPVTLGESVTSLDQETSIKNLEEVPEVRVDEGKENEEGVSYETNVGNAYADSGNYVSDSERGYESTGGDVKVANVEESDLTRRRDFRTGGSNFVSPELKGREDDDYVTKNAKAYSSLDRSGMKKDSKKKRERGF
tara:strand:+ start:1264 stop:1845 length:582 start_codon:yes stop_codon:yes gene_type:complete